MKEYNETKLCMEKNILYLWNYSVTQSYANSFLVLGYVVLDTFNNVSRDKTTF